ncbi:MAG: hypothetical protein HFJ48_03325 [Clostridia bacterium]|nr:hypothetical protein [Clostridia bacterium]
MRLRIDLKIVIFLLLFYLTKQIEIYSMIMFFCIIHELGHILMGCILGLKPEKIEIMPFGLSVAFKLNTRDYNKKIKNANLLELKKIMIAIAGPLTNLMITFLYIIFNKTELKIIYANLLILLFNLIPIFPLDGGRILKSIIHIFYGYTQSIKCTHIFSNVIIILLTLISSIIILKIHNIAIVIILIYLWILVIKENKRYEIIKTFYKI